MLWVMSKLAWWGHCIADNPPGYWTVVRLHESGGTIEYGFYPMNFFQ